MLILLTRKSGKTHLLTESQAESVAVAMADKSPVIAINTTEGTARFPWHDITGLDPVRELTCTHCGETYPATDPHYCETKKSYTAYTVAEANEGEIPKYPESITDAIKSRYPAPRGDPNYIAHMERVTNMKAEGGKTYRLPKDSEKIKAFKYQLRMMDDGHRAKDAYREAWHKKAIID